MSPLFDLLSFRPCLQRRMRAALPVRVSAICVKFTQNKDMSQEARTIVQMLLRLKQKHGTLNRALVREYSEAHGEKSEREIAKAVGLSKTTVHRALRDWS
ncbi:hypothetical protein [Epibacterium ulvae]|uniref:hypothetical protein n=1 Tax=Epibacterium ulvae TaxID=1156985 RepID=UPI002492ECB8|nr:hypothetical protein [Epibacterium ulvae]